MQLLDSAAQLGLILRYHGNLIIGARQLHVHGFQPRLGLEGFLPVELLLSPQFFQLRESLFVLVGPVSELLGEGGDGGVEFCFFGGELVGRVRLLLL